MTRPPAEPESLTCAQVKALIADWAERRDSPFPYLRIGSHLAACLDCLSWATEIALQPEDHYLKAMRLRLSDLLAYLGLSLMEAWSGNQRVRIRFPSAQDSLPEARGNALGFLRRYEGFSPETRAEAAEVRSMVAESSDKAVVADLEPYGIAVHLLETALRLAPDSPKRLSLTQNLGLAEFYRALSRADSGESDTASTHFSRAREHLTRVLDQGRSLPGPDASDSAEFDFDALVSARINLAGVEVMQHAYSEASLRAAVRLLNEARDEITRLGLDPARFTSVLTNLLISYLRLWLDHGSAESAGAAGQLVDDIKSEATLAGAFLHEHLENPDPELEELLARPEARELRDRIKHLR